MIKQGISLEWLEQVEITPEDLALDHKMDISGSIYTRMRELGITQNDLAKRTGMDRSQISRIITGQQNMTLLTLSKLEVALAFRLDSGFVYPKKQANFDIDIKVPATVCPPSCPEGWGHKSWKVDSATNTAPKFSIYQEAA